MKKLFISVMMGLSVCGALGMELKDKKSVNSQQADWNRMSLLQSVMKLPMDLQKVIIEMIGWPSIPSEKLSLNLPVGDYIDAVVVGKRYVVVALYTEGARPGAPSPVSWQWDSKHHCRIKIWDMRKEKWQEPIILDPKRHSRVFVGGLEIIPSVSGDDAVLSIYTNGIKVLYDIVSHKKISSLWNQDVPKEIYFCVSNNGTNKVDIYDGSGSSSLPLCYVKGDGFTARKIAFNKDKTWLVTALRNNNSSGGTPAAISVYDLGNYLGAQKKFMHQRAMAREQEGDKNKNYPRLRMYFLAKFDAARQKGQQLEMDDQLQKAKDGKSYRGFLWNIYQRCFDEDTKQTMAPYTCPKKLLAKTDGPKNLKANRGANYQQEIKKSKHN